jgi:hypothetical protein
MVELRAHGVTPDAWSPENWMPGPPNRVAPRVNGSCLAGL